MSDRSTRPARTRQGRASPTAFGAGAQERAAEGRTEEAGVASLDFIRAIVDRHVADGRYPGIVTRFPPEPNGFLHIGHVKSIALNFGIAAEYGGRCHLRFDDTNPETENEIYVRAIQEDVRWLGYDWGEHPYFAADYFPRMYEIAEGLIQRGRAYVDSSSEDVIREARGSVTVPGRPTKYRDRTPEENLDLFRRMRAGELDDGAAVLRARIDMTSPNMKMRDPVLYRIRHAHHYRTGDDWCIYPLYDYAHCLEDAFEGISHSICTLEFEDNREVYDWILDEAGFAEPRTHQYEFARLKLDYTVLSKRKLIRLVEEGRVSGWDDPRMPTVAAYRRRGVPPEALRAFAEGVGVTKADTRIEPEKLEFAIRVALNETAPRVMGVLRPLRLVVTSWPEGKVEWLAAASFPPDVGREGSRPIPFARELLIERDDFDLNPPKGYRRLAQGRDVRLRFGYVVRYEGHDVDPATGAVTEVRVTHDPDSRSGESGRGSGTIHWLSAAHALPAEVRLYDRLFTVPDPDQIAEGTDFTTLLNPASLEVLADARVEPSVADAPAGTRWQLERLGYFWPDPEDSRPGKLVLNRIVGLRDSWTRGQAQGRLAAPSSGDAARVAKERAGRAPSGPSGPDRGRSARDAARSADQTLAARMARYQKELGVSAEEADLLTADRGLADFFEGTLAAHADAHSVAAWVINELAREARGRSLADLPFGPCELGRLVAMVEAGAVSRLAAKEVLAELAERGGDPEAIVDARGLRQVGDRSALGAHVDAVLAGWPAKVEEYRGGKKGLLGFFVGQVVRASGGGADPKVVKEILEGRLGA
ncbi:MAG: glutamine--tRNA ligase/YqeY domain fusion protein [Gemmatimonadetes bacterium]|nr:glutamine--tRNA ligase/YqeY domain fusion protein [Gemmatimonadota bacterium]